MCPGWRFETETRLGEDEYGTFEVVKNGRPDSCPKGREGGAACKRLAEIDEKILNSAK